MFNILFSKKKLRGRERKIMYLYCSVCFFNLITKNMKCVDAVAMYQPRQHSSETIINCKKNTIIFLQILSLMSTDGFNKTNPITAPNLINYLQNSPTHIDSPPTKTPEFNRFGRLIRLRFDFTPLYINVDMTCHRPLITNMKCFQIVITPSGSP